MQITIECLVKDMGSSKGIVGLRKEQRNSPLYFHLQML